MEIREVAVIGLGTMGAGIAEVFARAGLAVTAIDMDRAAVARGMASLDASLSGAVARGRLTAGDKNQALGRITPAADLAAGVDAAMMLGCGYPRGPVAMLDDIGAGQAYAVLAAMHARYGDPAFAPVPLPAEHATARLAFHAGGSGQ
jgi:3-hydroxyacyl-CoA dehydrogenase